MDFSNLWANHPFILASTQTEKWKKELMDRIKGAYMLYYMNKASIRTLCTTLFDNIKCTYINYQVRYYSRYYVWNRSSLPMWTACTTIGAKEPFEWEISSWNTVSPRNFPCLVLLFVYFFMSLGWELKVKDTDTWIDIGSFFELTKSGQL